MFQKFKKLKTTSSKFSRWWRNRT